MENATIRPYKAPNLIGLYGFMRGGKDTVGDHLTNAYGYKRLAFGDPLRKVVYELYPEAQTDRTEYRRRMQDIGQHLRAYDPGVWRDWVNRQIAEYRKYGFRVVVTDIRQPNEYEALRALGAFIVRVDCPMSIIEKRAGAEIALIGHETERHYGEYVPDTVINNNSTLEHLYSEVDRLIAGGAPVG